MIQRLILELTPLCNLSCNMCPRHYIDENSNYMKFKLFKKMIDEAYIINKDMVILPFWRGESALSPDFIKCMNYVLDKGLKVHISTNGHFMSEEHINVFKRCEFVTFSIHTDIGYKNAIKFAQEKTKEATVQASFVDCEKSVDKYMNKIIQDKKLLGLDSLRLYKEHTIDGVFGKNSSSTLEKRTFCPKLKNSFVVAYDGSFSRCNHIWQTDKTLNLNDISLSDAWIHPQMKNIRKNYPDTICQPCDQWTGHTNGEAWQMVNDVKEHKTYGI